MKRINLKGLVIFLAMGSFLVFSSGRLRAEDPWGRIANSSHQREKIISALLFAGAPNPDYYYPVGGVDKYVRHPLNPDLLSLDWTDDAEIKEHVLMPMKEMGLNTIKLSFWHYDLRIRGETLGTPEVMRKVFEVAQDPDLNLLVAPFVEVSWPINFGHSYAEVPADNIDPNYDGWQYPDDVHVAGVTEKGADSVYGPQPAYFPFYMEYPDNILNLKHRIKWLLEEFGTQPNWLQLYDQNGEPRKVIWLIETLHWGPIDEEFFASRFDEIAEQIEQETGEKIGFIIDPTPLPIQVTDRNISSPSILKTKSSILAINPFNLPDVALDFDLSQSSPTATVECEEEFIRKSRETLTIWKDSGIPLIVPIMPGYDDTKTSRPFIIAYGENDWWREEQAKLVTDFETAGVSIDTWNGYTEGYVVVPTEEYGHTDYDWAKQVVTLDPTPPVTPVVTDEGEFTTHTTQLYSSWSSEDLESDIVQYQYRITQDSPEGVVVRGWTSTGENNSVTAGGFSLTRGKTYYFSVKAKNSAGLWSEAGYSDGITVVIPNSSPVLEPIANQTVTAGELLVFSVSASDPDGDPLTFKVDPLPFGAYFLPRGDVTLDGNLDNTDVTFVLEYLKNIRTLSLEQLVLADVDEDGDVDAADLQLLLEMVDGPPPTTYRFLWTPEVIIGPVESITFVTFTVSDGELGDSQGITISVLDLVAPEEPTGLTAQAVSSRQIDLNWNDVLREKEYELQRSARENFKRKVTTITLGADITAYVDTGLRAGKTYYYRIRAGNEAGYSGYSATVRATTRDKRDKDRRGEKD